jgi:hypothetical protein
VSLSENVAFPKNGKATKGVRFSKVIFKDSIGQFTYDANQTNAKTIINKINDIGNGKLYKVTDNK